MPSNWHRRRASSRGRPATGPPPANSPAIHSSNTVSTTRPPSAPAFPMSAASQAVRTAGRGAVLRPSTRSGIPLTRLPHQRPDASRPDRPPAGRGAGIRERAGRPSALSRSALAASVLSAPKRRPRDSPAKRDALQGRGTTPPRRFEFEIGAGPRLEPARAGIRDWFSSTERAEALEAFATGAGAGAGVAKTRQQDGDTERPFAWRDFEAVVRQLPESHWATGYVRDVARSLEGNPSLTPAMKEKMLDETLTQLSKLSVADDKGEERFQDA